MRKKSINGIDVLIFYIQEKNKYLIIYETEMYFSTERPVTDQEIEDMQLELEKLRTETNFLRNYI